MKTTWGDLTFINVNYGWVNPPKRYCHQCLKKTTHISHSPYWLEMTLMIDYECIYCGDKHTRKHRGNK